MARRSIPSRTCVWRWALRRLPPGLAAPLRIRCRRSAGQHVVSDTAAGPLSSTLQQPCVSQNSDVHNRTVAARAKPPLNLPSSTSSILKMEKSPKDACRIGKVKLRRRCCTLCAPQQPQNSRFHRAHPEGVGIPAHVHIPRCSLLRVCHRLHPAHQREARIRHALRHRHTGRHASWRPQQSSLVHVCESSKCTLHKRST